MDLNPSRIQGDAMGIKIPSDFYFRIYDSPTNFLKWDNTHLMTHPLSVLTEMPILSATSCSLRCLGRSVLREILFFMGTPKIELEPGMPPGLPIEKHFYL